MPKPPRNPGQNRPSVPTVRPETWTALMTEAAAFRAAAPWTWMHDSELVGLHHPVSHEDLLCSILGRLRSVFALLVFRREAGRRWILNLITQAEDATPDPDRGLEQDCLKLEFVRKREVVPEDQALFTATGFVPRLSRGCVWPAFRSMVPGCYPWFLTQPEADTLLHVLPRITAFATLRRDTPDLCVDLAQAEVPFLPDDFDPATRTLNPADVEWRPMLTPPDPLITEVRLPEAVLEELLALPQAEGFHLELDIFYSRVLVSDSDRPRFPKTVAAVDRTSGFVGGFQLAEADDTEAHRACAEVLTQALRKLGHRPESIHVQRPRLARMIDSVAGRLAIPVQAEPALPALDRARDELNQYLLS